MPQLAPPKHGRRRGFGVAGFAAVVLIAFCLVPIGATAGRSAAPATLVPCADIILQAKGPHEGGYRLVLNRMSVPPAYIAGNAVHLPADLAFGPLRYWHKTGMVVRHGDFTVTVSVPPAWRSRVAITWGGAGGTSLRFSGCPKEPLIGTWNAYAGGFYLRDATACVPLVFSLRGESTTVRFGIGGRCK
jgi:hypothetical protein